MSLTDVGVQIPPPAPASTSEYRQAPISGSSLTAVEASHIWHSLDAVTGCSGLSNWQTTGKRSWCHPKVHVRSAVKVTADVWSPLQPLPRPPALRTTHRRPDRAVDDRRVRLPSGCTGHHLIAMPLAPSRRSQSVSRHVHDDGDAKDANASPIRSERSGRNCPPSRPQPVSR